MRLPRALTRAAARAKPIVPAGAWPVLLGARSLIGDGPIIGEPNVRSVVVLAAHPDDESLGCAGTIALLTRRGAAVRVAFATNGEATRGAATTAQDTARLRHDEAVAACGILGVPGKDVTFWDLPDGGLPQNIPALAGHLDAILPGSDAVFLPWFGDGHADHAALSTALAASTAAGTAIEVWGYETWSALPANRIVDITSTWDRKTAAVNAHVTASQAFDLGAALGLNRWRSIHGLMGEGYAEAFLAAPVDQYLELRRQTQR